MVGIVVVVWVLAPMVVVVVVVACLRPGEVYANPFSRRELRYTDEL